MHLTFRYCDEIKKVRESDALEYDVDSEASSTTTCPDFFGGVAARVKQKLKGPSLFLFA